MLLPTVALSTYTHMYKTKHKTSNEVHQKTCKALGHWSLSGAFPVLVGPSRAPRPVDEEPVGPFVGGFDDFPGVVVHEAFQRTAVDGHYFVTNLD